MSLELLGAEDLFDRLLNPEHLSERFAFVVGSSIDVPSLYPMRALPRFKIT